MRFSLRSIAMLLATANMVLLPCFAMIISQPKVANRLDGKREATSVVTFDSHSIMVKGERILVYAGEFHPFRLGQPDLWLDVLQKVRALGFTAVSFYMHWGQLEGKPGVYRANYVNDLSQFFQAAKQAGVYLVARPGPYINGESSGGGIPGWVQRVAGPPRTRQADNTGYQNASMNYWQNMCETLAAGQVDNGGPLIMVQIENEYVFASGTNLTFDPGYLQNYEDVARNAGLVVPFSYNDITPPEAEGRFAYGHGEGSVEVYGQDSYPVGNDCSNPSDWGEFLPVDFGDVHHSLSPDTPMAILEYQGGNDDTWGGPGYAGCALVVNGNAERIIMQVAMEFVTTVQNIYMTFGGTNYANVGYPYGYTSYDYGAAIAEDRTVSREKYGNMKIVATGLASSYDFLTAYYQDNSQQIGQYSLTDKLATAQAYNNVTGTRWFIVRHADYASYDQVGYTLSIPTSLGNITIPQTIPQIFLNARDSKAHVVDYNIGNGNYIWYSSPDIFTFNSQTSKTVLVVYGGTDEPQEMAFRNQNLTAPKMVEGSGITFTTVQGRQVLSWTDSPSRRIVDLGSILLYILDRSTALGYWRTQLTGSTPPFTDPNAPSVITAGGYLMRTASVSGSTLNLWGDVNTTTVFEVIAGLPDNMDSLVFNYVNTPYNTTPYGSITFTVNYEEPTVNLPNLEDLDWKYIDDLPELQSTYDDSPWPVADIETSPNDEYDQGTPTSLSASDYGFHTGSLLFRGHFTATGDEQWWYQTTAGGQNMLAAVWFNDQYVGSFAGDNNPQNIQWTANYSLPQLRAGPTNITILVDHNGMDEQSKIGNTQFKLPRGVLNYQLDGHQQTDIKWKLTGNLGGEEYIDLDRGPLNEGAMYSERNGYHLPGAPVSNWASGTPLKGLSAPGARFYYATFDLDLPEGYDIPLSVTFANSNSNNIYWRARFFINGWNYGKYVNNVGPQASFPIPEGVINFRGTNTLAIGLWGMDDSGDAIGSLQLVAGLPIQRGYNTPGGVTADSWSQRSGAY